MNRIRAVEEFNKNRKIIIREVPPVTYDEVKSFMGPFIISNIAISKRLRHAIVELKHGNEAEAAVRYLVGRKLLGAEVKASLFRQDNLMCLEGLPREWGVEEFRSFVSPHGGVEKCFLYVDLQDRSLGYGFVEYVHNRELSEVARLEMDGRRLPTGHVVRCRFVSEAVTTFDQLGSTRLVVSNLPPEVGPERFRRMLERFGEGVIRPLDCQVGMTSGTTMERFGAAEFDDHDQAVVMWRRIDGRACPDLREEEEGEDEEEKKGRRKVETGAFGPSAQELRARFCTPGESLDDVMKSMTSVMQQVKGIGTGHSNPPTKLIHPAVLNILKDDPKTLNDFSTLLESMGTSNEEISNSISNIHFQTAVLSLMMSSIQNSGDSPKFDPQKLCSMTATLLKSVSSNGGVASKSKDVQSKRPRQNPELDPAFQPVYFPVPPHSSDRCNFQGSLPADETRQKYEAAIVVGQVSSDVRSHPPVVSEIASPWKLLPSFVASRPSAVVREGKASGVEEEPCPGYDADLAHIARFLGTRGLPDPISAPPNKIPSGRSGRPTPLQSILGSFPIQTIQQIKRNLLMDDDDAGLRGGGGGGVVGESLAKFHPLLGCGAEVLSHSINSNNNCSINNGKNFSCQVINKRKIWRPKVVEQCWNDVNDLENEPHRDPRNFHNLPRALIPPFSSSSRPSIPSPSPSLYPDISAVAAKKRRRPLQESLADNLQTFDQRRCFKEVATSSVFLIPSSLSVDAVEGASETLHDFDASSEGTYVGQHQQGLGGLYVDSLVRKRKFREALDRSFV